MELINADKKITDMLNQPLRSIKSKVELYGPTLLNTFSYDGALIEYTIQREAPGSKFFGCGVCQKIILKIRDKERKYNLQKGQKLKVALGTGETFMYPYPEFKIDDVNRDENTNDITAVGYDLIYDASSHTIEELEMKAPYTLGDFASKVAAVLGTTIIYKNVGTAFNFVCQQEANFEKTDNLRSAIVSLSEATQTVFYLDSLGHLVFRKLDQNGTQDFTISKDKYFTLNRKLPATLSQIVSASTLGDNVSSSKSGEGVSQYVRDNPFWVLREDVAAILEAAIKNIGGLTMAQYDCSWRGNFLLEIGDKISIIDKDNNALIGYCLSDSLTYNGGLRQISRWSYTDDKGNSAENPSSLGDALNQTFAKVNKVNKEIDLVVKQSNDALSEVSNLKVDVGVINAEVVKTASSMDTINKNVETITNKVNQTMSSDEVKIEIQKLVDDGVNKIHTGTGFTFDENGLNISKSGQEMKTQITEDGMKVFKDGVEVLTANNIGVNAKNLHATTYLIVGSNTRFEDYKNGTRTGCFWVG